MTAQVKRRAQTRLSHVWAWAWPACGESGAFWAGHVCRITNSTGSQSGRPRAPALSIISLQSWRRRTRSLKVCRAIDRQSDRLPGRRIALRAFPGSQAALTAQLAGKLSRTHALPRVRRLRLPSARRLERPALAAKSQPKLEAMSMAPRFSSKVAPQNSPVWRVLAISRVGDRLLRFLAVGHGVSGSAEWDWRWRAA
jgi:hypothetical protein